MTLPPLVAAVIRRAVSTLSVNDTEATIAVLDTVADVIARTRPGVARRIRRAAADLRHPKPADTAHCREA